MATSSFGSFLMKGTGTGTLTYAKLCDVKSIPALGGSPELLQTTTLSDPVHTNILGLQSLDTLEFTANYDLTTYNQLVALEGETLHFAVWFGATVSGATVTPTGSEGKFIFDGELTVFVNEQSVDAVREMTISIAASTPISVAE